MTQPRVEHLAVKTGLAAGSDPAAAGFWPPLPPALWLPPVVCLWVLSAVLLMLCLATPQSPQLGVGWLEPREAPLLLTWLTALTCVFLAPSLSRRPVALNAAVATQRQAFDWKIALQAAAVGLPLAGVAWAFHAVALLLDTDAASRSTLPTAANSDGFATSVATWLPAGLTVALVAGAISALAWLWLQRWPRAGIALLAAWASLPPLAWFLAVDVMSRDQSAFPAWLTVNPVYALVLLDRDPRSLPAWTVPLLLVLLAAVPATAALLQHFRRPAASAHWPNSPLP